MEYHMLGLAATALSVVYCRSIQVFTSSSEFKHSQVYKDLSVSYMNMYMYMYVHVYTQNYMYMYMCMYMYIHRITCTCMYI